MYQRILVPIDGSPTSEQGLREAIRLASLTKGQLLLLHVLDEFSLAYAIQSQMVFAPDWRNVLRQDGMTLLEKARDTARRAGIEAQMVLAEASSEPIYEQVVSEANRLAADLIVMGTHGRRGIRRTVLGSAAEGVSRRATIPLLLVNARLVTADASDTGHSTSAQPVAA